LHFKNIFISFLAFRALVCVKASLSWFCWWVV